MNSPGQPALWILILDGVPLSPAALPQADAIWRAALATGRRIAVLAHRER